MLFLFLLLLVSWSTTGLFRNVRNVQDVYSRQNKPLCQNKKYRPPYLEKLKWVDAKHFFYLAECRSVVDNLVEYVLESTPIMLKPKTKTLDSLKDIDIVIP